MKQRQATMYDWLKALHVRAFAADANGQRQRYFRFLSEVVMLQVIAIVILVVVRPFGGGWPHGPARRGVPSDQQFC
jgi:hypothetical protein